MARAWVWLMAGLAGCTAGDRDGDLEKDPDIIDPDSDDSGTAETDTEETEDSPKDTSEPPIPDSGGHEHTDESDVPDTDESDLPDTDLPADTIVVDTMVVDTVIVDTVFVDTMVVDTVFVDTMVADTVIVDTTRLDTHRPIDSVFPDTVIVDTTDTARDTRDSVPVLVETGHSDLPVETSDTRDSALPIDTTHTDLPLDTQRPGDTADSDTVVPHDSQPEDSADSADSSLLDTDPIESTPPGRDTAADSADTDLPVETGFRDTSSLPTDSAGGESSAPPVDTDLGDTGGVDEDTGDDTGDSGSNCDDDAWWEGADLNGDGTIDLPFRVVIGVTGSTTDLDGPPVFVDIDFRAELRRLGERSVVDDLSIRVVNQSCSSGFAEVPSQFVDGLVALPNKVEHMSAIGDQRGTLAFVYDEDGAARTHETLRAGQRARFAVYFTSFARSGGTLPPAAYATDLNVSSTSLSNSLVDATFDPNQGGLLDGLRYGASPNLTSQTAACCGNSMFFYQPNGWVDPQDGAAPIDVVANGPVLGALRSTGVRTATRAGVDVGSYEYEALYWMVAGRPELYHVTTQTTLMDSINEQTGDITEGFRPWESRQTGLSQGGPLTYDEDVAAGIGAVTAPFWGVAFGLMHRPEYVTDVANPLLRPNGQPFVDYFAFYANDWVDVGLGSPITVPADVTYFDHVGVLVWPYSGTFARARPEMEGLMHFVDAVTLPPERL